MTLYQAAKQDLTEAEEGLSREGPAIGVAEGSIEAAEEVLLSEGAIEDDLSLAEEAVEDPKSPTEML